MQPELPFMPLTTTLPLRLLAAVWLLALGKIVAAESPLQWEAQPVQFTGGDASHAEMKFTLRNDSAAPITIKDVQPSCGCTTVEAPPLPWTLSSRESGVIAVRVDLRGKHGELHKTVRLATSAGHLTLPVKITIPVSMTDGSRGQNRNIALADSRAIFRGDCARCHVAPAAGKSGAALFHAACAICHEANPRADLVPDLAEKTRGQPAGYLRTWITEGKAGTLMPPFAREKGGILDAAQIESLVRLLQDRQTGRTP
jgi:mono/diheme cytochrome c family protein